jgi:lantibiotic modifying enzyme
VSRGWTPVLTGDARQRALDAVVAVGDDLRASGAPGRTNDSLAAGATGLALMFGYLDSAFPERGYDEAALDCMQQVIDGIAGARPDPSLHSGIAGTGWVAAHLESMGVVETPVGLLPRIDEILATLVVASGDAFPYPLIEGLVGVGVYALERIPAPSGVALLECVVGELSRRAVAVDDGLAWKTPVAHIAPRWRATSPDGNYNVGMAHGMAGILGLLGGAYSAGVRRDEIRRIAEGVVSWLETEASPADELPAHIGVYSAVRRIGRERNPIAHGWCYGDPGVCVGSSILAAALGREDWLSRARDVSVRAAACPPADTTREDLALCHGSGGLMHAYNRLHRMTGDPRLRDAAVRYAEFMLSERTPGEGIGGWRSFGTPPERRGPDAEPLSIWYDNASFLDGSAGIALALLAAAGDKEPAWDRVLMFSIRNADTNG